MSEPRYMTHVMERQTQEDINGVRCWHCYQLVGNLHADNCMAPFVSAREDLAEALQELVSGLLERIGTAMLSVARAVNSLWAGAADGY